jgi:hypothetical protein
MMKSLYTLFGSFMGLALLVAVSAGAWLPFDFIGGFFCALESTAKPMQTHEWATTPTICNSRWTGWPKSSLAL